MATINDDIKHYLQARDHMNRDEAHQALNALLHKIDRINEEIRELSSMRKS